MIEVEVKEYQTYIHMCIEHIKFQKIQNEELR